MACCLRCGCDSVVCFVYLLTNLTNVLCVLGMLCIVVGFCLFWLVSVDC